MQNEPRDTSASSAAEWSRKLRHDLGTPLNQIIGYAAMLAETAEDLGQKDFVADLGKIERAGWKLLELVDTLTKALRDGEVRVAFDGDAGPFARQDTGVAHASARGQETGNAQAPKSTPVAAEAAAFAPGALLNLDTPEQDSTSTRAFGMGSRAIPHRQRRPSQRRGATGHVGKPQILVVDDNAQNLEMLSRRLIHRGYTVRLAMNGREALASVAAQSVDLLLLDVMMPEISGTEVLVLLREQYDASELPIIMATACDSSADIVQALRLGANDYVTKPLDFEVVIARVQTQLALKQARDHIHTLNQRLDTAHDQIASLSASDSIANWAKPIGEDLCQMIGAREATLWLIEDDVLVCTVETEAAPPAWSDVTMLPRLDGFKLVGDAGLFSVVAANGTPYGVLVVRGERVKWREHEVALVGRYARQFGGAIELQRVRQKLEEAALRRQATREDLLRRGVELVHVCPSCGLCNGLETEHCREDGEALAKGRVLPALIGGRYRFVRLVGEGGMGTVYQAVDERLSREVAVKVMRSEHFDKEEARGRFSAEATAIAQVEHVHVISVFDSGELEDGSPYMITEMLHGNELSQVLRRDGRGTPAQVARLLRQTAGALAAAHGAGLVHRDVKPENIFLLPVTGGFMVKVLDFGVAKQTRCETHLTQTGQVVGTPIYMSPEQLTHKPIDARSDLYSLAATIYEALVGRRVTLATDIYAVVIDVVRGCPPPVSSLLKKVPREVDDAFRRGLAKSPDDRPADMEAWASRLADQIERMPCKVTGWQI